MICGAPTPATTRVVQIEPGPTPTLTASAPASTSAARRRAGGDVAADDLDPVADLGLELGRPCRAPAGCARARCRRPARRRPRRPASSPAPRRRRRRRRRRRPAAGRRCPWWPAGCCSVLTKSLTVISPVSRPWPSTIGSFSILCRRSRPSAASAVTPSCAVISGALVITSATGWSWSTSKRMSRLVMMPTSDAGVVDDGQPGDPEPRAHRVDLGQRVVRAAGDRVGDHAGLRPLHGLDLAGLLGDRQVAVQHAHAAGAGHRDRHPRLGDGVHRRADQRHPQPDLLGELTGGVGGRPGTTSEAAGSSRTSSKVSPSIATLCGSSPPVGTGSSGKPPTRGYDETSGRAAFKTGQAR